MSLIETLSVSLATIGFVQLGLALVALAAYALAINGSLGGRWRSGAALAALLAAAVFSALTPSWMGGLALMLMAVLVMAAFAAATWLLAAAFDLDVPHASGAALELPDRVLRPVRTVAAGAPVTVS